MAQWLQPDLTTVAFCWRLSRRDGVVLGLTSHDQDLLHGGLLYCATPGMIPSAIERSVSLEPDNVELSGVLTSAAISSDDLATGRWDGASLKLFMVDWTDPNAESVHLIRGHLGTVQMDGEQFQVELLGATTQLDSPIIETTSPSCRAALGDKRCRVDLAGRSLKTRILGMAGLDLTVDLTLQPGNFAYGAVRWLSGANAGLSIALAGNDGQSVTLAEPAPDLVGVGDWAELIEGCDKLFSTCRDRFGNAINFRGEPHLPGNDLLMRYVS